MGANISFPITFGHKKSIDKIELDIRDIKGNHLKHLDEQVVEIKTDIKLIERDISSILLDVRSILLQFNINRNN